MLLFHGLGGNENTVAPIGEYCIQVLKDTRFINLEGVVKVRSGRTWRLGWFQPPSDKNRALEGADRPAFGGLAASLEYVHWKFDELIDKGMELEGFDRDGAIKAYHEAQKILDSDTATIFVADLKEIIVKNVVIHVVMNYANIAATWKT